VGDVGDERYEKMDESYLNNTHLFFLLQLHQFIITFYNTLIHFAFTETFSIFFIALAQRENTSLSRDLNPDLPYRKPACYQLIFVALY
jgi:hypothetical protein